MEQNPQSPPGGQPPPHEPQTPAGGPEAHQPPPPPAPPPAPSFQQPPPPPPDYPPAPAPYAPAPNEPVATGGYTTGLAPKNPVISLIVSLIIPGVGTIMNGETGKGIAILIGYVVALFLIIILVGLLLAPAVWIYGMYDAYQGAKKWNVAHGFPPAG